MKTETLDIRNMDCMELMRGYPDNHFDLAVVDPPYGIGMGKVKKWSTSKKCLASSNDYKSGEWDNAIPDIEYFRGLTRVSKEQIIWGGNYYAHLLPASSAWLAWDKVNDGTKTADVELAWSSFKGAARMFRWMWRGFLQDGQNEKKIHICQKPVALYDWIFANCAERGMKILDTHMGSGSIAIAAHYAGMHLTACELDADYYKAACERIDTETRQATFF